MNIIQLVVSSAIIFWFDLFIEARAEILTKISMVFLVNLKAPKGHFEMNLPLDLKDKKKIIQINLLFIKQS